MASGINVMDLPDASAKKQPELYEENAMIEFQEHLEK